MSDEMLARSASVRACCSGAPMSYEGLGISSEDRALSEPRPKSYLGAAWTDNGRDLLLADLDRLVSSSNSKFDGRMPSKEGLDEEVDSSEMRSAEVLGSAEGFVGDGGLRGRETFLSPSAGHGWLEGRR